MDDLLNAYIYEIKKGTKLMALITTDSAKTKRYVEKIKKNMLSSAVVSLGKKDNIFFGISECVEIFRGFYKNDLSLLSAQEDFILGIMLGYNRVEQCKRYLNKINLCPVGQYCLFELCLNILVTTK